MNTVKHALLATLLATSLLGSVRARAGDDRARRCRDLPSWAAVKTALDAAVAAETSGLDNQMWATLVDRDGFVCAVAFSGTDRGAQWPGSRAISAQKANTANAFSLDASSRSGNPPSGQEHGLALSTANLFTAVQPGQSLYGLQHSNPVDPEVAYRGDPGNYGTATDPMTGRRMGGVNVFGGGLALYALQGGKQVIVGGLGVSGDTSCTDHFIAYRLRHALDLDHMAPSETTAGVPGPASLFAGDAAHPDNIIFDIAPDASGHPVSASGFGHPTCLKSGDPATLPAVRP